ncbi:hypothetical protein SSX86_016789 [Deinandra increscens subsp. villosa]|uniref:Uncharacterized protein n=1 Tax=Deinandra increscens subsp. villosa TaxID=3103831 RepID=A0AAP0D0C2_9ASTR
MCPVLDLKDRNETTMEASTSKDHTVFVSMPKDNNMKPESKHKGMELDEINCRNDDEGCSVKHQSDDATASSSSFGDTFSDLGTCEYDSDNEVMSDLRGEAAPVLGGSAALFPLGKKRVTSHWRKFVQPIMWRCKWVELQLRKFESMAIVYDREIEKYNQTKQLKYNNFELEGHCAKSIPFLHDSQRRKLMKRKIRKRHEESDTQVYMSLHNLSLYLGTYPYNYSFVYFIYVKHWMSPAHGPTMDDDDQTNLAPSSPKNAGDEFRVPDELLSLDFRDGYSLEQILWKIEVSHSQVSKMKNKLDTVTAENAVRISSTVDLILHESDRRPSRPVREPDFPTDMEGPSIVATFASQLIKLNTGDVMVEPENTASEFTHAQDANESMEALHSVSRKRSTDGILIYNRRAKKPQKDSGTVKIHPIEKPQAPEEEKNNNNTNTVSASEDSSQNEQRAPKIRSISKLTNPENQKKRAARACRKSGSSQWSRRTSG